MNRAAIFIAGLVLVSGDRSPIYGRLGAQATPQATATPLTPAAVALLGNRLDVPALEQLRTAIAHDNPDVRAVAARVAGIAKAVALAPHVTAALERESNERAAAEQVRALLFFGTTRATETAERQLAKAGSPGVDVYLEWLIRTRPENLAERIESVLRPLASADLVNASPASIHLEMGNLPRECESALAALARLSLPDPEAEVAEGEKQWVIVPIYKEYIACAAEVPQEARTPINAGRVEQPRKIRDVRPGHPLTVQQNRIQGVVILEAIVTPSGCVNSVEVLRSAHPLLDFEAVKAVAGWRYTPTLLDGQPVPVIMTVTVNFTLR